jgi:glutamine synthetase
MASEKSLALLETQEVLTRGETLSRLEIYLEGYSKQINVEASTMIEMCRKEIIPAMITYLGSLAEAIWKQESLALDVTDQKQLLQLLHNSLNETMRGVEGLYEAVTKAKQIADDQLTQATAYRDEVVTRMVALRKHVDLMEIHTDKRVWPIPSYDDLLFRL